jgi:hypothetical protein
MGPTHKLRLGLTTKETHDLDTKNKVIITNGFAMHGVQFKPPTTPSSSSREKFLNFEMGSHVSFVAPPLLWTWRTCMEPLRDPIDIWGRLATSNWMISFKSLTIGVICNRCELFNCLHFSWDG